MPLVQLIIALIVVGLVAWLLRVYLPMSGGIRTIVDVVLMLIVVGMALWLINTYVPMAGSIKAILNIVVVVTTCVGVLRVFGLWNQVVRGWRNLTTRYFHAEDHASTPSPKAPPVV
ncbi:MAG: Thivi_2564 family membrane protein [Bryobacteraceae bacterium]